jgi:polyhydroxybutyrate depolymerase
MQKNLVQKTWKVNGVTRTALVYLPKETKNGPFIFAFHGHGGNSNYAARKFRQHELWPEAIVIYPQGLPTQTSRDPQGRKPGWQMAGGGGFLPNRDLDFFEAMLETAQKEWGVDNKRIYAMGHSNGAGFVYYLWGQKPELFAALAEAAGAGERLLHNAKPCPVLCIGAKNDPIVKWEGQEQAIEAAKRVNGNLAAVEVVLHNDGHMYQDDFSPKISVFFKKHVRK